MFNSSLSNSVLSVLSFGGSINPTNLTSLTIPSSDSRFICFHPSNPSTNSSDSNFLFSPSYIPFTPLVNSDSSFITNSNIITTSSTISPVTINFTSFWYGNNNTKTMISYSTLLKPLEITSGDSITIEPNQLVITFFFNSL